MARATWVGVDGLAIYPRIPLAPGVAEATVAEVDTCPDWLGPVPLDPTDADLQTRMATASYGVACYGIDQDGRPYYQTDGAPVGEQALIKLDEVTGRPFLERVR